MQLLNCFKGKLLSSSFFRSVFNALHSCVTKHFGYQISLLKEPRARRFITPGLVTVAKL